MDKLNRNFKMKYNSLQILRGFAAWIVVFHHFVYIFYKLEGIQTSFFTEILWIYGSFGVDVFFVLSGFIMFISIYNKNQSSKSFILNRLFRIMPLYWFYTVLLLFFASIIGYKFFNLSFNLETIIKSFLLIPHNNLNGVGYYPILYVGWTLIYEMFFYFVLALSLFIRKEKALLISVLVLFFIPIIFYSFQLILFGNNKFLLWEFISGITLGYVYYSENVKKIINSYYFILITIISIIIIHILLGWNFYSKFLISTLMVALFLASEDKNREKSKFVQFLIYNGNISYSIYLSHIIILGILLYFFKDSIKNIFSEFFVVLILTFSVYYLSRFTYNFIESSKKIEKIKNFFK